MRVVVALAAVAATAAFAPTFAVQRRSRLAVSAGAMRGQRRKLGSELRAAAPGDDGEARRDALRRRQVQSIEGGSVVDRFLPDWYVPTAGAGSCPPTRNALQV